MILRFVCFVLITVFSYVVAIRMALAHNYGVALVMAVLMLGANTANADIT